LAVSNFNFKFLPRFINKTKHVLFELGEFIQIGETYIATKVLNIKFIEFKRKCERCMILKKKSCHVCEVVITYMYVSLSREPKIYMAGVRHNTFYFTDT